MKTTNKRRMFENIQNDVKRLIKDEQKTSEFFATIDAFLQEYKNLTGQEKERLSELFWVIIKSLRNESIDQITDALVELNDTHLKKINSAKDKISTINSLISKVNKKSIEDIERIIEAELIEVEQSDSFEYERLNLARLREISEKAIDEGEAAYVKLLNDLEKQGGLTPIVKSSDCLGYRINDMKASVASSGYTAWCTARINNNMFDKYSSDGLSIFYFPKEVHTYNVTNDDKTETVIFGRRFGVTIDDLNNQVQTEENSTKVIEFIDLLEKNIGIKKTNEIINNLLEVKLFAAAKYGNTEKLKLLLEAGAELNAKDKDGYTALMWAAYFGNAEVVKLLLEFGADIEAKDKYGRTALEVAVYYDSIKVVKLLKQYKAVDSREKKDVKEMTRLMYQINQIKNERVRLNLYEELLDLYKR